MLITVCPDYEELGKFYKKWTGKDYDVSYILWNSYFMVARDENWEIVAAGEIIVIPDPFWNRSWGLIDNVFALPEYQDIIPELVEKLKSMSEGLSCQLVKVVNGN